MRCREDSLTKLKSINESNIFVYGLKLEFFLIKMTELTIFPKVRSDTDKKNILSILNSHSSHETIFIPKAKIQ